MPAEFGHPAVARHPHEAHFDVYARVSRLLVTEGRQWDAVEPTRNGVQYILELPAGTRTLSIWERTT
jgi:hypothetical protein